ncbi:MAG TPA: sensor histidine kinase [Candidatus Acidoferrales bacterium]|nr:sensor histidine kinase [Candidatus Acidoferrales bacterium]
MDGFQMDYERALKTYLREGGETSLKQAYEFGRRALGEGKGILDMIAVHQQTLEKILGDREQVEVIRRAGDFFAESMGPFEMTHRAFGEANETLRRLNESLESETRRISRALHDESGQLLAAVHIQLMQLARNLAPPGQATLREIESLLEQIEQQLRNFSHELRPTVLDDYGLLPALQSLAERFSKRFGTPVSVDGKAMPRLTKSTEAAIYRVAQEALNNVARHAKASRVHIRLWMSPGELHCRIRDDGVGFDPAALPRASKNALGLLGIRERLNVLGGSLEIQSAPQQGTELKILVPLED